MPHCLAGVLAGLLLVCDFGATLSQAEAGIFGSDDAACEPWYRFHRAGNPHCVAPWACQTYGPRYCGYYVGGGAPVHGEGRCPDEGTWGLDYAPWYSRVRLNWWHGRYQGGEGQYEPDAPNHPLRNGRP